MTSTAADAGTTRDVQKQRLYDADRALRTMFDHANEAEAVHGPAARQVQVCGSTVVLPVERRFGDLAGVQRYCDAVLALPWVRARWSTASTPIMVRERRAPHRGHYEPAGAVIAIPASKRAGRFTMGEIYVLHEITHHLAPFGAHHGPQFAGIFLELVEGALGPETGFVMRACFLDHGVQIG